MQRSYTYHSALFFALLTGLLLPFPWQLLPFQQHLLPRLFGAGLYMSDSSQQAIFYAVLAGIALVAAAALRRLLLKNAKAVALLQLLLTGYLAAVLARYGADKILKHQFYLPEPTTLYTPLGKLDKDILYWSTIGTSRPYNLFLGGTELLAAILLVFRRTRRLALLLATSVFIQVLAVDLCFGIGVRLFSTFLLCVTLLLLAPDARQWIRFLQGKATVAHVPAVLFKKRASYLLRALVVLLLLTEGFWPALRSGNWNDDAGARPPLHGAYEVRWQSPAAALPVARMLFVHRAGYLVLQDSSVLHPYESEVDVATRQLRLKQGNGWQLYSYEFNKDSTLQLYKNGSPVLRAKAVNWRALPALH